MKKHTVQMTLIFTYGNCWAKRRTCLHELRGKFTSELRPEFNLFPCSYCLCCLFTTNRM